MKVNLGFLALALGLSIILMSCENGRRPSLYYLTHSGDDNNPGTEQKPWKTLQRLQQTNLNPGDCVYLAGGDVFTGTLQLSDSSYGLPENPITISSFGNGKAIIQAGSGHGIELHNKNGIHIFNLEVRGEGAYVNQGFGVMVINDRPGNKKLKGISIKNVNTSGFRWAGIFVGGIPNDLPGFKAPEGCRYGYEEVTIENCKAWGNLYFGIYVSAPWHDNFKDYGNRNVTIRDCSAYENSGDSLYTRNHSGSGIMIDDTQNGIIEYCSAYRNGALNGGLSGGPIGIWTNTSDHIRIQYCESYENRTGGVADGGGFDMDGGVTNSITQYCYSHDNDGAGFLVWNYYGAPYPLANNTIRFCISENDGRKWGYGGIHIGSSGDTITGIQVYHNTVYMPPSEHKVNSAVWLGQPHKDLRFYNNLFITSGSARMVVIKDQANAIFLGNAYYPVDGTFMVARGNHIFQDYDYWEKNFGQERLNHHSTGILVKWESGIKNIGMGDKVGDPRKLNTIQAYIISKSSMISGKGITAKDIPDELPDRDFKGNPILGSGVLTPGAIFPLE